MAREPDDDVSTDVGPREDDDAFLRRLKLVSEIDYRKPFPIEAFKEWAETILVAAAVLIWLYAFEWLVEAFIGLVGD